MDVERFFLFTGPYIILKHRDVQKDEEFLEKAGLLVAYHELLDIIKNNPHAKPPEFHEMLYDLKPCLSRDVKMDIYYVRWRGGHRLVYRVDEKEHKIIVFSACFHYRGTKGRLNRDWDTI